MKPNWQKEIEELHIFFERWLSGSIEKSQENYARFESVMADSFQIIAPGGNLTKRAHLLDGLYTAHASRPELIIWIKNPGLSFEDSSIIIATYEEWQTFEKETTSRLSSVVFQKNSTAPNQLSWLHVHETGEFQYE